MSFSLHPTLERDTFFIESLGLCDVRLMDDRSFPWLVLVPRVAEARELFDLMREEFVQCMQEVRGVAKALQGLTNADKMNVAALGNMVAQLHIHVIARFTADAAWPQPVWNSSVAPQRYTLEEKENFISHLKEVIFH